MTSTPPRVLFQDDYLTVNLEPDAGLVRYARNSTPYPSVEIVRVQHERMAAEVSKTPLQRLAILIDIRDAPARNDDAFENEITRAVAAFVPKFRAHAFLVKSAVGRLQARRLATSRGDQPRFVFSDEAEALEHLRAQ